MGVPHRLGGGAAGLGDPGSDALHFAVIARRCRARWRGDRAHAGRLAARRVADRCDGGDHRARDDLPARPPWIGRGDLMAGDALPAPPRLVGDARRCASHPRRRARRSTGAGILGLHGPTLAGRSLRSRLQVRQGRDRLVDVAVDVGSPIAPRRRAGRPGSRGRCAHGEAVPTLGGAGALPAIRRSGTDQECVRTPAESATR